MTLPRATAIPAALVVVLTVVGAWYDGSRSSATDDAAPTTTVAVAATSTAAAPTGLTSCTSVVHIGDSTSVGMMSPDYIADPALRLDAQYARVGVTDYRNEISGGRSIVEALPNQEDSAEVAARQKATGYEGCWVLALGTTDAANLSAGGALSAARRIDRMFEIIGDDPVLWVNVKTLDTDGDWSNTEMQAWNQALTDATARHPNLHVYDWAAIVPDDWFQPDHRHYTSAGYVERSRLIADALVTAYPA